MSGEITRSGSEASTEHGIDTRELESIFESVTPILGDNNIIRAVVWQADEQRVARLLRLSQAKFHLKNGHLDWVEEKDWPVNYQANVSEPHRLGGLIVHDATWRSDWDGEKAFHDDTYDFFYFVGEVEKASLPNPEDIFETCDNWQGRYGPGGSALVGGIKDLKFNIYSPDGLEDLIRTAPRE